MPSTTSRKTMNTGQNVRLQTARSANTHTHTHAATAERRGQRDVFLRSSLIFTTVYFQRAQRKKTGELKLLEQKKNECIYKVLHLDYFLIFLEGKW